ncbi:RNA-binding protein MEX3B [Eurosta solidaginis]|uniref:RNA-binding protein MEX3B n=1 Tax=Eurosta solidaginis TaxID=178769 RepID=UPI00353179AA
MLKAEVSLQCFSASSVASGLSARNDLYLESSTVMADLPKITAHLQIPSSADAMSSSISRNTDIISSLSKTSNDLLNSWSAEDQSNQLNRHTFLGEDQRTLQLAFELSFAGLTDSDATADRAQSPLSSMDLNNRLNNESAHPLSYQQQEELHHVLGKQQELHSKFDLGSLKFMNSTAINGNSECIQSCANGAGDMTLSSFFTSHSLLTHTMDERSKKSQNMTECVPVPSSEHVAEIVGRQGCKIKALRAKTNTYIKTPVRGEEPVFVVTGRKEDVTKAKREILSAAEHFSLIRATRKSSTDNSSSVVECNDWSGNSFVTNAFANIPSRPSMPGQVTIQVRVPYRVVGLVVGPKGTTIKHIQHQTQTYIVTPSREKEPIFEVTGLPNNVQSARQLIEAHIALRTGSLDPISDNGSSAVVIPGTSNDVPEVHSLNVLSQILNDPTIDSDIFLSLCKDSGIRSTLGYEDESCEVRTEKAFADGFEPNDDRKTELNAACFENKFVENQISFRHLENFQFQYFSTSNQTLDDMSGLADNFSIKACIGRSSNVLADLDNNLQKKNDPFPSPFQTTFTLNQNMQSSSFSAINKNRYFRSDGSVSSYKQINLANYTGAINSKAQGGTEGSPGIQSCSINSENSNNNNRMTRSCSSASSTASSRSANNSGTNSGTSSRPELINIWKNFGESLDLDEGFGDLPNIWTLPTSLSILKSSNTSPSTSMSPTDSFSGEIPALTHSFKDGVNGLISDSRHECRANKSLLKKKQNRQGDGMQTLLYDSATPKLECLICNNKKVNAVLVPCGHNMFCMECANRICEFGNGICPICSLNVYHVTRLII